MTRRQYIWWRKYGLAIYLTSFMTGFIFIIITLIRFDTDIVTPNVVSTPDCEATPTPMPIKRPTKGRASYYSLAGCIGCREDRLMANGEVLDDNRPTVAYNHLPLNTPVTITNDDNGKTITVPVTDRGGFERHGKIADLSLATKTALSCGDVCNVSIEY